MTLHNVAAGRVSIPNEILWSNDPRIDLVPNSLSDQTAKLQLFLDTLTGGTLGGERVGYLVPGSYRKSGELLYNNNDGNKPTYLYGGGGKLGSNCPSLIVDTADAGGSVLAPKYSVKPTSTLGYFHWEGWATRSLSGALAPGAVNWNMRGILLPSRCTARDVSATGGYFSGCALAGDHLYVEDCNFQGNTYPLEVPPGVPTQGDIKLVKIQAGDASRAGLGVAKSSTLAGFQFEDVELSNSPYCLMRYDDGSATSADNWIVGGAMLNIATEFAGHGIVYDDVGDGKGIRDVVFDHGTENWALYDGTQWSGRTHVAAWYNTGPIGNVEFLTAFPTSKQVAGAGAVLPALKANGLPGVHCRRYQGNLITRIGNGERLWDNTPGGGSNSGLRGCYAGSRNGMQEPLVRPYNLSGTVAKGELLKPFDDWAATKWTTGHRFIGLVLHDQTNGVVHAGCGGQEGVGFKNTSGSTINDGDYLIPHSSGGVAGSATWTSSAVGRATAQITDGAVGAGEIFGIG